MRVFAWEASHHLKQKYKGGKSGDDLLTLHLYMLFEMVESHVEVTSTLKYYFRKLPFRNCLKKLHLTKFQQT